MNNVSVLKLAGIACGALGTIFGICMCAADFVSGGPNVFGAINSYRYAAITTNLLGGLPTANTLTVPLTYSFDSVLARAQVCAAFAVFALVTFIAATVIGALTITGYLPDLMRYGMPAFHILAAGSSLIYFSTAYSIYNDTASFYAAGGGEHGPLSLLGWHPFGHSMAISNWSYPTSLILISPSLYPFARACMWGCRLPRCHCGGGCIHYGP